MSENQQKIRQNVNVNTTIDRDAKLELQQLGIGIGRASELYLEMRKKEEQAKEWENKFRKMGDIAQEYRREIEILEKKLIIAEQKIIDMEKDKNGENNDNTGPE